MAFKTDIEIAREAKKKPIMDIGAKLGIPAEDLLPYGHDKAKVSQTFIEALKDRKDGKLIISKTANGESPLVQGASPILGVDVWEHSYYIDYRNRRPDYLAAFVDHLINWEYVEEMYRKATA